MGLNVALLGFALISGRSGVLLWGLRFFRLLGPFLVAVRFCPQDLRSNRAWCTEGATRGIDIAGHHVVGLQHGAEQRDR
eukprot:7705842-Pyramimonas_sp.AAC.1